MSDPVAVRGQISGYRTLADGTLRLAIDLSEVEGRHFHEGFAVHTEVAIAAIDPLRIAKPEEPEDYGNYAKALRLSVFFGVPEVWKAAGSDEEFLAFVRTLKCCARSGTPCDGPIQAAHVWRLAAGAGKGVKPPYSAVPLCAGHHRAQHATGEDAIGGRAYMEKQSYVVRQGWVWEVIKDDIGVASMADAEPTKVYAWCRTRGIEKFLPAAFTAAA